LYICAAYVYHGHDCDKSVVTVIFSFVTVIFVYMTVIFSILNVIGYILTVILCILTEMCRLMTVILTSVTVIPPPIYGCDISPISRYHITYNLFIISRAPRSLLLIAAMNVYTVTLL